MKELDVAVDIAILAGRFIKSRVGKLKEVQYKGEIDIVTDVDKKAEALIIKNLKKSFPEYGILAEESIEKEKGDVKWIIDPIDGTTNFAHGFPFFAVSIALEKQGKTVLGIVYDPMRDELFSAVKGKGAYLNKKKIMVSNVKDMGKAFLATGFSYNFKKTKQNNMQNFFNFMMASMAVRRAGAASLDLCCVACGRFDGFWELDLCPWDTAAAELIIRESGGKVSKVDGSRFSNYEKSMVASNGLLHKEMLKILAKGD